MDFNPPKLYDDGDFLFERKASFFHCASKILEMRLTKQKTPLGVTLGSSLSISSSKKLPLQGVGKGYLFARAVILAI